MFNFLKKRGHEIYEDRFLLACYVLAPALAICHACTLQKGFKVETLVRFCFCLTFLPGTFFFKREYMFVAFPAFGLFLQYFSTLNNYTAFLIIMVASCYKPRRKWPMIILYFINFAAMVVFRHKDFNFAQIHVLNCVMIYFAFNYLLIKGKRRQLELTPDERTILQELAGGTQLKAVESFSKNTVTKKLKEARERNGCINNSELLYIFKNM